MKGFLPEFYIDQNADRAYRDSFEAALMPEVRLLHTLQCLFDEGCVLQKSAPWALGRGNDETVRVYVYSVLSDLLFYLLY